MLLGVGMSVDPDTMAVVDTGVSVRADGLVGFGTPQDGIENSTVMAITKKHAQEPFLPFIQFMSSPLNGGSAKYCLGVLHNQQLWLHLTTVLRDLPYLERPYLACALFLPCE